jgi:Fur family peroxide stress response transcriptional regulator
MITNKEELRTVLQAHGVKPTFQRLAILGFVADTRLHPTIRSLHTALVKQIPTLSKTTLYSTLELFAAKGLVRGLTIDPSEVRYDGIPGLHHHFYCTVCRNILDVDITCATGRTGELHGHRVDEVHGYFKGICRDCRSKESRPSRPASSPNKKDHKRRSPHV